MGLKNDISLEDDYESGDVLSLNPNETDADELKSASAKNQNQRNYEIRKKIEKRIEMQRLKKETEDMYDWD